MYFSSGVKRTHDICSSCAFLISAVSSPVRTDHIRMEPSKCALANMFSCRDMFRSKQDEKHIIYSERDVRATHAYSLSIGALVQVPHLDGAVLGPSQEALSHEAELARVDLLLVTREGLDRPHSLELPENCFVLG